MLQNRPVFLSATTIGGALIGLALEKYSQGSAMVSNRYITAGVLGGLAGGSFGAAFLLSKEAADMSGKPNWSLIGGAAGASATLLYHLVKKNYNMKTLITTSAIAGTIGGGIGTAISVYQKTK